MISKIPSRISWQPILQRLQASYDKVSHRRVLSRLWRISKFVRNIRNQEGAPQDSLDQKCNALSVEGVIYAIYCWKSCKIYVGQTVGSSFERFKQHVQKARKVNTPLYRDIRRIGFDAFGVFPLEKIPVNLYPSKAGKQKNKVFTTLATPRERFWIDHLHTGLRKGWNVQFTSRKKVIKRGHNPMKWRRARCAEGTTKKKNVPLSKSWERRCVALARLIQKDKLREGWLLAYNRKNIWGMVKYLLKGGALPGADDVRDTLCNKLRYILRLRPSKRDEAKSAPVFVLKIPWSPGIDSVPLRKILCSNDSKSLLPHPDGSTMDNIRYLYTLSQPIGTKVFNYSNCSRTLNELLPDDSCPCRKFPVEYRPDNGCVSTGDLNLLPHRLKILLSYGPKFREPNNLPHLDAIIQAVDSLIHFWTSKFTLPHSAYGPWKSLILKKCRSFLKPCVKKPPLLSGKTLGLLRYYQKQFIFVPVDKASGNIACICRRKYCQIIRNELKTTATYELCQDEEKTIIDKHIQFLKEYMLTPSLTEQRLPYLYCIPKLHKPGYRFIAGSSSCTTTKASKALSSILQLVLKTLRRRDDSKIVTSGIRRYFIIDGHTEMVKFLRSWKREEDGPASMRTFDFTTLYTKIELDDLISKVNHLIARAAVWMNPVLDGKGEVMISVNTGAGASWEKALRPKCMVNSWVFNLTQVENLLRFVISNTFLKNGNEIRRQCIGIPMGTNSAPALANTYLHSYESNWIDKKALDEDQTTALSFHLSFRLIDDLCSLDNVDAKFFLQKNEIYPASLKINETTESANSVNFIGLNITSVNNKFILNVHDKRSAFPFSVIRYPHALSAIPRRMAENVYIGQLHRFYGICSHRQAFVKAAVTLTHAFCERGYTCKRLCKLFNHFCHKPLRFPVPSLALVQSFHRKLWFRGLVSV